MAFNGSGTFVRLYNWVNDKAANIKVRADRMDNEMNGMATGLSTCITKDGQTTITANLPMAGFKHTGVANGSSRTDYASVGQTQDAKLNWVAAGGTVDVITASYSPAITTLVDGQLCHIRTSGTNVSTTPTFSPNGLTARTIVKNGGTALVAGDIPNEAILRYNLVNTRWELLNPIYSFVPSLAPFVDSTAIIKGSADATKLFKIEVDGFATGTTRVATPPDKDGVMAYISDIPLVQDFRLTLTSGTPVTTTDVTGASTVYCCPYKGNRISLYNGSSWNIRESAQFSLALGTISSGKPYDVFCYDDSGTPTLEFTAWTNDSTRATALAYQDGVLVKSGATTRRYLGTFYTTSTTTTEDSLSKRFFYNYYHRAKRPMYVTDATSSWTYTTATLRQANGSSANQIDFIQGVAEDEVSVAVSHAAGNATSARLITAIGLDSTTTQHANCISGQTGAIASGLPTPLNARLNIIPAAGRHFASWLEYSEAAGTTTWYTANVGSLRISGITGEIMA